MPHTSPGSTSSPQPQPITMPPRHANQLISSTSPYLLQHAYNPVDWHPWSKEAIDKARAQNKPIFLSIGYSACHWCHVMEREVFEKQDIANIMNEHFINIKVDREERPDLDDLYMLATQLMSGSGGWPMSVWLTPDLEPFYAGTYFPPQDAYGRPGFPRLELAIADSWKNRRNELLSQAKRVVEAIRIHADETNREAAVDGQIDRKSWYASAVENFADKFDEAHGGLGSAPKFPPHQALALWLAMLRCPNAAQLDSTAIAALQQMTTKTLDAMMKGGIYDHVAGAFARYSTDERWHVPHFEKMLYDNAQLAPVYAQAAVQFNRADYARIARQTLDFWLREMTSEKGAFYSTLDADSEGQEGKFYVWTADEIRKSLPNTDDANLIIEHLGIRDEGNWHETPVKNGNVLFIARSVEDLAHQRNLAPDALQRKIDDLLAELRKVRASRAWPGLDDKILTGWNGLMISAMAVTGRLLREPRYLEAAHRAIGVLLTQHTEAGKRLLRVSRPTKDNPSARAHTDAFLEDHAYLLNGLMDLIDSTSPTSLPGTMARKRALELADTLLADFEDKDHGGFFFTGPRNESLFVRMKNASDNATPSPNALAIRALLRLAHVSGKEQYRDAAMRAIHSFAPHIHRRPDFFPTILRALLEDSECAATHRALGNAPEPDAPTDDTLPIALEPTSTPDRTPVMALTVTPPAPVAPGATFEVILELAITEGYHIQPHRPADREAFATVARLRGNVPLARQEWIYPDLATAAAIQPATGYSGKVRLVAKCALIENVAAGRYTMRATVLAQPCTDRECFPPEKVSADFTLAVLPQ